MARLLQSGRESKGCLCLGDWAEKLVILCARAREDFHSKSVCDSLDMDEMTRVRAILRNPAYAGAYVYGRWCAAPERRSLQTRHPTRAVAREEWDVCIRQAHPGYISWEEYMEIGDRLADNVGNFRKGHRGTPRRGRGLLQGVAVCGSCGRHMALNYSGDRVASAGLSLPRRYRLVRKAVLPGSARADCRSGDRAPARHHLLEILEDRYGHRSTLVTSQLPVARWFDLIGDPTYADAILDRLVHNAHRLKLFGESMRRNAFTQAA